MISQQVSSSDSTLIPIALSTLEVGADPNVRAVAVAGAGAGAGPYTVPPCVLPD